MVVRESPVACSTIGRRYKGLIGGKMLDAIAICVPVIVRALVGLLGLMVWVL